jgi:hypothetical protein
MTPERRARLVRIVVDFLLADMEREAADRAGGSGVGSSVSDHTDATEDVP